MRWVLMLFVILAAVMGGEARAVVVSGRAVVIEWDGRAETVEERAEALRVESERASRVAVLEVQKAAGLVDAGPLEFWFPGGSAVARSDCGDRQAVFSGGTSAAEYTETAAAGSAAGSAWTVPSAATVQHVRGPDVGGGTKGLLYSLRNGLPTFNRYNGRGDVVAQSDIDGTTTWAASYQADGRRTAEAGTNVERHRACTKEEDPTGLLNEGFRYRDLETGTFISRDPLGHVDGPNVYCYVRQNPWTMWDPEGLFVGALVKRINEHIITPAAEGLVGAMVDALPQSAVAQLSSSRGFESAVEAGRTVSGGIMHGSQEALGMLSPMDGAADKLLQGDLSGAVKEAAIEAGGGRVFKAAGKGIAAVKRHAGKLDEAVGALSHADDAATATATGVRESIEEASSVLAKEGGGVAKGGGRLFQSGGSGFLRGGEMASDDLIRGVAGKYEVETVGKGHWLNKVWAESDNAMYSNGTVYLRPDARKIEVLEEFLHGTQDKLGLMDKLGYPGYEVHVKQFMLRHQKMLGIGDADASVLRQMLQNQSK
jgi:RHS repeat-associated protein